MLKTERMMLKWATKRMDGKSIEEERKEGKMWRGRETRNLSGRKGEWEGGRREMSFM